MPGDASMDSQGQIKIVSAVEMSIRFQTQVVAKIPQWQKQLSDASLDFADLELEIQKEFLLGAGYIMAGLVAVALNQSAFEEACEETRKSYDVPLAKGRMRSIRVQLVGGLIFWINSLYCEPKRGLFKKKNPENVPGLYVSLAQLGFANGCSPGLECQIARRVAGSHSFDFAIQELQREGINIDYKVARRITYQCGQGLLTLRTRELVAWRNKKLLPTNEFTGQNIVVQIDGGRVKTRSSLKAKETKLDPVNPSVRTEPTRQAIKHNASLTDEGGRGKASKRRKRTFVSDWREPKLATIFVIDENGKQRKKTQAWIDATLEGPDHLAELVAMRLFQLGVGSAKSISFVSDGAPWIWDRLDRIMELAGVAKDTPVYKILDCCHAVHQMSDALKEFKLPAAIHRALYRLYRKYIREGNWELVVQGLERRLTRKQRLPQSVQDEIRRAINYLRRHGTLGHMNYPKFALAGVPLGSGAVESSIRRVINLRLKSNGTFWKCENAEAMLQIRCHYVSKRLDERLASKRISLSRNGKLNWNWDAQDMRSNVDHQLTTSA